jgi:hypothetical protein
MDTGLDEAMDDGDGGGEETFCNRCYRHVDPDTHRCRRGAAQFDDEDDE